KEDQTYGAVGKRVYMAYDSETAELLTIVVGSLPLYDFEDNDFATETAITSAVGTKHLARKDCKIMGLYGTGRQARRHLKVMCDLRPVEEVKVFSRSAQNRQAFCALMQSHIEAEIIPVDNPPTSQGMRISSYARPEAMFPSCSAIGWSLVCMSLQSLAATRSFWLRDW